jgi:hypothetical protein
LGGGAQGRAIRQAAVARPVRPLSTLCAVVAPQAAAWRALRSRGFADLSPPEAEHALLELPTDRADYIDVLEEMGDYPARSPIGHRIPDDGEIDALKKTAGRWRAVALLEDERALRHATGLFSRVFVLDPFYDCGALLYSAWHDPLIKDEHARRLAQQAGLLIRAGPLLHAGTALLAPDHLPGSWNPRPGWRQPRRNEDRRQHAAWSMRSSLVLLYWADRLDGVVCATRGDVAAALEVALGASAASCSLDLQVAPTIDQAQAARQKELLALGPAWADARRLSRRRTRRRLEDVAYALTTLADLSCDDGEPESWRLMLGRISLPDPALLIRRVLNGQDPERHPPLPAKKLKRRPLCLVPAQADRGIMDPSVSATSPSLLE